MDVTDEGAILQGRWADMVAWRGGSEQLCEVQGQLHWLLSLQSLDSFQGHEGDVVDSSTLHQTDTYWDKQLFTMSLKPTVNLERMKPEDMRKSTDTGRKRENPHRDWKSMSKNSSYCCEVKKLNTSAIV